MEIWSRYPENIKRIFIFQVTIVFVCKLFMLYSCKRICFIFSVLIKSDFRLIWAINSFSSTILLHLSDERKEPISTIWSTQRERHAVWSLVDLKALVALQFHIGCTNDYFVARCRWSLFHVELLKHLEQWHLAAK